MNSPDNKVQAFLAAGHVCSVMGYWEYPPLAEKYRIPIVVTGFEPLDLLDGIRRAVIQLENGRIPTLRMRTSASSRSRATRRRRSCWRKFLK